MSGGGITTTFENVQVSETALSDPADSPPWAYLYGLKGIVVMQGYFPKIEQIAVFQVPATPDGTPFLITGYRLLPRATGALFPVSPNSLNIIDQRVFPTNLVKHGDTTITVEATFTVGELDGNPIRIAYFAAAVGEIRPDDPFH
jgi:hypothetical protein